MADIGIMINTHHYRVQHSAKHANELITRIPVSYLKWMVNAGHSEAAYAAAELERRGTTTPEFEISGHAVDGASLRLLQLWKKTSANGEGLHAWLARRGKAALDSGAKRDGGRISHDGVIYCFEQDCQWPVLKTVMLGKPAKPARGRYIDDE